MNQDNKKQQFQLIDGQFVAEEAQEILISLIDNKIGFHERKDFSLQERFGETEPQILSRIDQLKQTRKQLVQLLEQAIAADQNLSINCTIEIALKPKQSA